jgi:hypothetical protein
MNTAVCRIGSRAAVSAATVLMLAVALVILCSPAVQQVAGLQESSARRAVSEEVLSYEIIGPLWAAVFVQIPLWITVGFYLLGSELGAKVRSCARWQPVLWALCIALAVGGILFFQFTRQRNLSACWGPSPLRFAPLMLCGLTAGIVSSTAHHKDRWATALPWLIGFFVIFLIISGSKPYLV